MPQYCKFRPVSHACTDIQPQCHGISATVVGRGLLIGQLLDSHIPSNVTHCSSEGGAPPKLKRTPNEAKGSHRSGEICTMLCMVREFCLFWDPGQWRFLLDRWVFSFRPESSYFPPTCILHDDQDMANS